MADLNFLKPHNINKVSSEQISYLTKLTDIDFNSEKKEQRALEIIMAKEAQTPLKSKDPRGKKTDKPIKVKTMKEKMEEFRKKAEL